MVSRMLLTSIAAALMLVTQASCIKSYYQRELVGNWEGIDWQRDGVTVPDHDPFWFNFGQDSTYASMFGGLQQQGKYWIDGFRLYTLVEGEFPIKVKLESLEQDTLTIGMNRAGRPETLVLVRR